MTSDTMWIDFVAEVRRQVERYGADRTRYAVPEDVLVDLQVQSAKLCAMLYVLFRRAGAMRDAYRGSTKDQKIAALQRRVRELEVELEKTPSVETPGGWA